MQPKIRREAMRDIIDLKRKYIAGREHDFYPSLGITCNAPRDSPLHSYDTFFLYSFTWPAKTDLSTCTRCWLRTADTFSGVFSQAKERTH
jgi:hypothetical protein